MSTDTVANEKIICKIDGAHVHSIELHLKKNYSGWTLERYMNEFPGEPILSEYAKDVIAKRKAVVSLPTSTSEVSADGDNFGIVVKKPFNEMFDLGKAKAALNARGEPIMISVYENIDPEIAPFIPEVDDNFVFDIETTKNFIIGHELAIPMLAWGYHGTGKTSLFEQIAARTKRGFMRVQHTANTEESHIVGQYVVKNGATEWQNGPLANAMRLGMVYCADEYDFALPNVTAVYQPVLEGKALIIKEAPPEFRVVKPHPNFRFVATGNTNGSGDETGLYQGTQIQNAANYSRFGITEEIGYMQPKVETAIVAGKAGVASADAEKFVNFAKNVRDAFANGKIGSTISPRELITAAKLGRVRGSDWKLGIGLAFANRLSRIDKEVISEYSKRVFG
jgi:cobaltochelatase CobS